MSAFIAFTIPNSAIAPIRDTMRSYQDVLATSVSQEKWHCTMLYIGNINLSDEDMQALAQPIRQSFHPVITILSLGEGKAKNQLWAYVQVQTFLQDMRNELLARCKGREITIPEDERIKEFIPHIHVGNIQQTPQHIAIIDTPVKTTFSLSELVVYKSNPSIPTAPYEQLAVIPITP
ncbi:MAG: hypothetical protein A3E36_00115 [Candidatus Andersenbacteria bacterium RIFCSPHIGHO2_12_FULL_45_11b]|uniref:RNA 2',3'-cyclic 3'-phosphodiesterase n=1 Tax=Candidatus Andersenbacteria bacterium RIFCSPHIGHO2_12_FULL_45_11b TaxID=1797282 RepID=A0A1G1XAH1_9BACT|nr:MAG: hypothetical protein A3E36_00115 [Candidatus Andersenbacteria bacterium RIFCSPHIGHO2_12_FULL_45_11b]